MQDDDPTAPGNWLHSNLSIDTLLGDLREFRRIDNRGDLLAFRLAGESQYRSMYVYLYGDDPDMIHFDLEDSSIETGEWDHAVHRGSVFLREELRAVACNWLRVNT